MAEEAVGDWAELGSSRNEVTGLRRLNFAESERVSLVSLVGRRLRPTGGEAQGVGLLNRLSATPASQLGSGPAVVLAVSVKQV